jgi:hypothetical protein
MGWRVKLGGFKLSHQPILIFLPILIMSKRKRTDKSLEMIGLVFDQIFAAASNMETDLPDGTTTSSRTLQFTEYLRHLKSQILSEATEEGGKKKAAKEFTLDEAVEAFGLTYSAVMSEAEQHFWNIDDLPETKNFTPTPCIGKCLHDLPESCDGD